VVLAAVAAAPAAARALQPAPAATPDEQGELEVAVTYKGKGDVSPKNEISVFLFTDPNISESSMPVGVGVVETNGGVATFKGLPPVVYIAVVYDDAGTYERDSAPPPGTPVALYGSVPGTAEAVKTGKGAKVNVTFDDSTRMGQ
jgi:hypothetical protein